jgi:hypothetical protein
LACADGGITVDGHGHDATAQLSLVAKTALAFEAVEVIVTDSVHTGIGIALVDLLVARVPRESLGAVAAVEALAEGHGGIGHAVSSVGTWAVHDGQLEALCRFATALVDVDC